MGLQEVITLSFLMEGHTKFAPDWCFGLCKRRYRHTIVSCMDDIVRVVEQSAEVNAAQLVGAQLELSSSRPMTGQTTFTLHSARVPYGGSNLCNTFA